MDRLCENCLRWGGNKQTTSRPGTECRRQGRVRLLQEDDALSNEALGEKLALSFAHSLAERSVNRRGAPLHAPSRIIVVTPPILRIVSLIYSGDVASPDHAQGWRTARSGGFTSEANCQLSHQPGSSATHEIRQPLPAGIALPPWPWRSPSSPLQVHKQCLPRGDARRRSAR